MSIFDCKRVFITMYIFIGLNSEFNGFLHVFLAKKIIFTLK